MTHDEATTMAERAAMALAEVGVRALPLAPVRSGDGWAPYVLTRNVPLATAWRAWCTAGGRVACLNCYRWEFPHYPPSLAKQGRSDCFERGLGTLDCGAHEPQDEDR